MKNPILIALLSLTLILVSLPKLAAQQSSSTWSTQASLPGERVMLYLIKENASADQFEILERPKVKNASLQILQYRTLTKQDDPLGDPVLLLPILIIPDAPGEVTVEDIPIKYVKSGKSDKIKVSPLKVYSTSAIKWFNNPVPYGVLWALDKEDPYVDESIAAQMKILLPEGVQLSSLPNFTTSGMKILPFQFATRGMLSNIQQGLIGRNIVLARGEQWTCYDLSSSIIPYSAGKSEASGRVNVDMRVNVFSARRDEILLPTLSISALPLPPGAPKNYDKLVGSYAVQTATDAKSLAMYESVDVTIRVTGSGALEHVECPKLIDSDGWKLIPATQKVETDINGNVTAVIFNQLIRPTREEGGIPAFRLSYFNPETQQYEEALSKPIPLAWKATDASQMEGVSALGAIPADVPPAGEVPVAHLTDIYNSLPDEVDGQRLRLNPHYYYILYAPAALIALYLLITWLRQLHARGTESRALERQLREISKLGSSLDFLRQSAAFIEKNLAHTMNDELRAIVARRDQEAFRPDAASQLSEGERKSILAQLRRAIQKLLKGASLLLMTALCLFTMMNSVEAKTPTELDREGVSQYEKGQYSAAIDSFSQGVEALRKQAAQEGETSLARLYYHLGNSYYRLKEEGYAALSYARALEQNSSLKEAEANLGFIQRKQGAILMEDTTKGDLFTFFDADELLLISVIVTAILLTSFMLLMLVKKKVSILKFICIISLVLSLACAGNWLYYYTLDTPHISTLAPEQLAYVIAPTEARNAADEKGASVVRLPASTPLRVLARRPRWDYIECMNGVRGWVPSEKIALLAELEN